MARTRQKSKQRKAKRQEQQRKVQGTTGQKPPSNPAEQAVAQQAQAYEIGDVLEETGGDPEVADERLQEEDYDEAIVPVEDAARAATTEAEPAAPAKPGRLQRLRRAGQNRAEVEPAERKPAERKRAERRPQPRAAEKRKEQPRQRGRIMAFLVSVWAELRRVQWPDRNQVTQATAVVLVFCLIAGAYLAISDWVFNEIIQRVI